MSNRNTLSEPRVLRRTTLRVVTSPLQNQNPKPKPGTFNHLPVTSFMALSLWLLTLLSPTPLAAGDPPTTSIAVGSNSTSVGGYSIVTCSKAGLQFHRIDTLERTGSTKLPFSSPHDLAFSADGSLLAIGGGEPAVDGSVAILQWPSGDLLCRVGDHEDVVMSVCWLSENQVASASLDGTIQIWSVTQRIKLRTLAGHSRGILALCTVGNDDLIVSAGIDRSLRVWHSQTGELVHSLTIHTQPINCLATRPNQSGLPMVASACEDQTVRFWQPTIGRMVRFVRLESKPLDLVWLPDGSRIIAICTDGSLCSIDPETVAVVTFEPVVETRTFALALLPQTLDIVVGNGATLKRIELGNY